MSLFQDQHYFGKHNCPFSLDLDNLLHICLTTKCYKKLLLNKTERSSCQAIIWTNAGMLLIRTLGTNFSEILSEIHIFSFKKIHLKMSSGKRRPFCLGLNVLNGRPNGYPWSDITVYPKKYAHGFVVLCFVVVMQSFIMNSHEVSIHIHQGCFAGTGAIVRLPQCQWSKPDGYGKISQCITTTKHSKAKTVCIFLGILLVTPCLLTRIREFIHTHHRNTTRGRRPGVVLRCLVWINSRIRVSKQGVTNLPHAQTIFMTFWTVFAALKSQPSH